MDELQSLSDDAFRRIEAADTPESLEQLRIDVLGRKGKPTEISKSMVKLPPAEKAETGKQLNLFKKKFEGELEARKASFESAALAKRLDSEWLDLTLPAPGVRPGSIHPITQIQTEIEQLFVSLGFTVLDGPEVETEYNNFDALNIPKDHPARD